MVCIVGDGGREGGRVFSGLINFATQIQTHFQPCPVHWFSDFQPKMVENYNITSCLQAKSFQTKIAQKPYSLRQHITFYLK